MKNLQLIVLTGFFILISAITLSKTVFSRAVVENPELAAARDSLEVEKIRLERDRITSLEQAKLSLQKQHLRRNDALSFYGTAGFLASICLSLVIVATGYRRKLSVFIARIRGAEIPIPYPDLSKMAETVNDLALAEKIEATAPEKAFALYERMADRRLHELQALRGVFGHPAGSVQNTSQHALNPAPISTPTFSELFRRGEIGPGKRLICGFAPDGSPQHRNFEDLKAVSVAGWQGSGKTLSMAYLATSLLLIDERTEVYVVDPHFKHPQGLGYILQPLERTGRLHIVNPFDLTPFIADMNTRINKRLADEEPSAAPVVIIFDEFASFAKANPEMFKAVLIPFLERCTEEVRKANCLCVIGSTKWGARHFAGRADIRELIPSLLLHKTKASQADLLVEDSKEKKLVKALTLPGQALLSTSHDADPCVVTIPFIQPADILEVAQQANGAPVVIRSTLQAPAPIAPPARKPAQTNAAPDPELDVFFSELAPSNAEPRGNVIAFPKGNEPGPETGTGTAEETANVPPVPPIDVLAKIREKLAKKEITLSSLATHVGVNKGFLHGILGGKKALPDSVRGKLAAYLTAN
jgi:hypothetical protein